MSDKSLETLKVVIDATSKPLQDEMRKIRKEMNSYTAEMNDKMAAIRKIVDDQLAPMRKVQAEMKKMQDEMRRILGIKTTGSQYKEMEKEVDSLEKGMKKLVNARNSLENHGGDLEYTQEFKELSEAAEQAEKKLAGLNEKMDKLQASGGDIEYSQEYKEIAKAIEAADTRLQKLIDRQEKLKATGVRENSRQWKSLEYDIEETGNSLRAAKIDMDNLSAAEKFQNTSKFTELQDEIDRTTQKLNVLKHVMENFSDSDKYQDTAQWKELNREIQDTRVRLGQAHAAKQEFEKGTFGSRIKKAFSSMASTFKEVTQAIKKVSGAFAALIQKFKAGIPFLNKAKSSMRGLHSAGQGMGGMFQTIGMTAKFMFASFAIMGTINGAKEGFKNLAQYSDETNRSISTLYSGLITLKNAFAVAFAPILNVVTPYLDTLINYLVGASNAIGQFFAALTGKSTWTKAVRVQKDYAGSLDNNASSANKANEANKKLQRTILGFDEINKMDDNSDSSGSDGGGSGGGAGAGGIDGMFSTESVTNEFSNFAQMIKDAWANADFTEIGTILGTKLKTALEGIDWDGIQQTAMKIGKSVATFLNGVFETPGLFKEIGVTIGEALNTGIYGAKEFIDNFHWDSFGIAVADSLNGILESFDFSTVGETLAGAINGACTSLFHFATTFKWEEAAAGIVESVKSFFDTWDAGLTAESFSVFADGVFKCIKTTVETMPWDEFGEKVYLFIAGIHWWEIFKDAIDIGEVLINATLKLSVGAIGAWQMDIWSQVSNAFGEGEISEEDQQKMTDSANESLGNVIEGINPINLLKNAFSSISTGDLVNDEHLQNVKDAINNFFTSNDDDPKWIDMWLSDNFETSSEEVSNSIANWWDTSVKPLFTSEYWSEKLGSIKEGFSTKWEEFKTWWSGTAIANWWENDVKPLFTSEYWTGKLGSIKEGFSTKWTEFKTNFTTWVSNWWNNDVKPKFTAEYWKGKLGSIKSAFSGKWDDLKTWFTTATTTWWDNIKTKFSMETWLKKIGSIKDAMVNKWKELTTWWEGLKLNFPKIKIPKFEISFDANGPLAWVWQKMGLAGSPSIGISWVEYANGGYPGAGQLFVANEAGPELVGKMGNKTTVANQNQIAQGFADAVYPAMYNAVANAMSNQSGGGGEPVIELTIKTDSETLYKQVLKGQKQYNHRYKVVTDI